MTTMRKVTIKNIIQEMLIKRHVTLLEILRGMGAQPNDLQYRNELRAPYSIAHREESIRTLIAITEILIDEEDLLEEVRLDELKFEEKMAAQAHRHHHHHHHTHQPEETVANVVTSNSSTMQENELEDLLLEWEGVNSSLHDSLKEQLRPHLEEHLEPEEIEAFSYWCLHRLSERHYENQLNGLRLKRLDLEISVEQLSHNMTHQWLMKVIQDAPVIFRLNNRNTMAEKLAPIVLNHWHNELQKQQGTFFEKHRNSLEQFKRFVMNNQGQGNKAKEDQKTEAGQYTGIKHKAPGPLSTNLADMMRRPYRS